ncbi:MAG: DciA family protein [Planctomycetota bacterium]|jgi:hypothetical protein
MDDERERLLRITAQRPQRSDRATRLGVSVQTYLDRKDARFKKSCSVVDVWRQALPPELYDNCELVEMTGGTLRVEVEPGPYMHEMRMLSSELVAHLQNRCRRAGVKKIVLVPAKSSPKPKNRAGT